MKRRLTARGRETRGRVIAAARATLIEDGAHALTLRAVALRAEMSLGNLQFHFPNVDVLLEGLLEEEIAKSVQAVEQATAEGDDALDAALDLLLAQQHDRDSAKLYFSLWALAVGRPAVARVLRRFYEAFVREIAARVPTADAAAAGDELEERAWLFVALLEGASVLRTLGGRRVRARDDALRRTLRALVLGETAPATGR